MQNYIKANRCKIYQEESKMISKMKCRISNVKMNMKGKFENLECLVCNSENESQNHIME